jgi:hypothetical protein
MIEMLTIYSKGFLENITIEELPPLAFCANASFSPRFYNDPRGVIPAKAGIQTENTGFPRIKYGAGLSSPE